MQLKKTPRKRIPESPAPVTNTETPRKRIRNAASRIRRPRKIRGAVSEPDPMGKSPKRTTGAACGNCPHHHFVETTLHSRYQNSCATPEGNHQQRNLLRGLTPTTETAGSCGAPGHREASVPGGGCPFPGREHVPGAWKRPTLPSARVWSP